ncbi:MAG TPA: DedA family protein [Vicinamibacteria bacterium]|nr:DedA family protein [Vicinamibacteria bacterium]
MDWVAKAVDLFLHLDKHLGEIIQQYGLWTYAILTLVVFCETGLVVTPFLPGDSLLFAAGALAALPDSPLSVWVLFGLLFTAAVIGDAVNYWIGSRIGPRAFEGKIKFLNKKHLDRTHEFYERYGGKTIIIARFVPIVRTFAPFVAGVGSMTYRRFFSYNVIGAFLWVSICLFLGYWFGNLPFVKKNFSIVILAIVFISILPAVFEFARHRMSGPRAGGALPAAPPAPEP